jgi:hypothetical protein
MDGFVGVVVRQRTEYMVGVVVVVYNTDKPIHSATTCSVHSQTTTTTPTMYSVL